ncbi:MAG: hypothetical protein RRA92_09045 [Gemmatimonadota bacterium]|nr:hypothetical protein [Gemmatimonadota bacterium]
MEAESGGARTRARDMVPGAGADGLSLAARTLVQERLRAMRRVLRRDLDPDDLVLRPTAPASRRHLLEEAQDLYWNELNWEELTREERIEEGALTEMVFPGLLALVDALLPRARNGEPDRDREHRDVAHDLLLWLAERLVELRSSRPEDDEDRRRLGRESAVTDDLVDIVAGRLYRLSDAEMTTLRD